MKRWMLLGLLAGTGLCIFLVLHFGLGVVRASLARLGWLGFGATVGLHLVLIAIMGLAWWQLARFSPGARPRYFMWGRLIRDAGGEALPFSQLGGFLLGARAVSLCGVPGGVAAATTIVDLTSELAAKIPYMLIGLAVFVWLRPGDRLIWPVLGTALLLAALAGLAFALQRRGVAAIERLAGRIADRWSIERTDSPESLSETIHVIYGRRGDIARSIGLHFVTWLLSAVEIWLPLWFMGATIGIGSALVIDSLLVAIRGFAFFVPNALGVQEGAYIMLCGMFGVPPPVGLALSLLRRGRDLAIGAPALLAWQFAEGRLAWRRSRPDHFAPAISASHRVLNNQRRSRD